MQPSPHIFGETLHSRRVRSLKLIEITGATEIAITASICKQPSNALAWLGFCCTGFVQGVSDFWHKPGATSENHRPENIIPLESF